MTGAGGVEADSILEYRPAKDVTMRAEVAAGGVANQVAGDLHYYARQAASIEPVPKSALVENHNYFVKPSDFARAQEIFLRSPTLVIVGYPGTGRRAAALHLLGWEDRAISDDPATAFEVFPEWDSPKVEYFAPGADERRVVDLSFERDELTEAFGRQLRALNARTRTTGSRLVILVTPEIWRLCAAECADFAVRLGIPRATWIVERRLHFSDRQVLLQYHQVKSVMRDLDARAVVPADAVDVARRLMLMEDPVRAGKDVEQLRQELLGWQGYISQHLTGHTQNLAQLEQRALLIAVAVLDGAKSEAINAAVNTLLEKLKLQSAVQNPLASPEISDNIAAIGASIQDDRISISRDRPGVGLAIVDRLWEQRPAIRKPLLSWLAAITAEGHPASTEASKCAETLLRLANRHRALEVVDVIRGLLRHGANSRHLAVMLLERLAVSQDMGAVVRRSLYRWAREGSRESEGYAVAAVCRGELGRQAPSVALVRLRLLLDNERFGSQVTTTVDRSIRAMCSARRSRLTALRKSVQWVQDDGKSSAVRILLAVMSVRDDDSPGRLLIQDSFTDRETRAALQRAWQVLSRIAETNREVIDLVRSWRDGADSNWLDRATVVDILEPSMRGGIMRSLAVNLLSGGRTSPTRIMMLDRILPPGPASGDLDG
ncbi:hypothetical protein [Dactylosporangium sp. NPDC051484]|uniref:hypothetical protein n=1 Tax=Dactylosporangium sp. NPDC051484 TaxID=3154942 RepID=UPI0034502D47